MSVESLQAKQAVIDEIKDKFERAKSAVVVDYMGITVEEADSMRKQLREAGIDYTVYKNTLVNRAIQGTEFESLAQVLSGPSAFAFGYEDATAPARELNSVIKKLNKMTFKAGIVEGEFYDQEGILAIAKLPSRDELNREVYGQHQVPCIQVCILITGDRRSESRRRRAGTGSRRTCSSSCGRNACSGRSSCGNACRVVSYGSIFLIGSSSFHIER